MRIGGPQGAWLARAAAREIGLRAVHVSGGWLYPDTLGDYARAWAWRLGQRDLGARRWIGRAVQAGMATVDVGAHLGAYTLALAHAVGARGRVLALEPDAHNFDLLTRAAPRWRLPQVDARLLAAADYTGWTTLHRSATDRADHRIVSAAADRLRVTVRAVCLDELLADWPRVDLVKLAVQGAEVLALRGLRRTLAQHAELRLLCTVAPALLERSGAAADALFEPLAELGLRPHVLRRDGSAEPVHPTVAWGMASAQRRLMVLFAR
ncbi:MAG: FkbM family methyltransferase [Deltaproteobacteria bacterium]|nr:FkbM family methyltransferase [Deltaproteobacteria bacterium]